ncbi:unnamed protein product [Lasius platythorax]|uniref:Uncharacterized protein n=1 Tax=Lasius platythorax TaxID=488582 RepID=A0AAV2N560_9HYME
MISSCGLSQFHIYPDEND